MRLLKSQSLLSLVNSYVVDSPQPANLSYMWNFGSLLALCLGIQIVTGVLLAMHYTPNVDLAFISVEHIMRDVNYGWMIRYIHANVASFFFIFVYLHIARGLYYGSYKSPRVLHWSIGVIILVLMMGIAFLGYVLPYGQMSLWGATVITNMLSAVPWIGQDFVQLKSLLCLDHVLAMQLVAPVFLPTIGTVNVKALRVLKARDDKSSYSDVTYDFLAMFVGFVDGDGYIKVTRTMKGFISLELVISLDIRDKALLEYMFSVLKVGRLYFNKNTVKYIIGRVDLQEVIFPLLSHHGIFFITKTRRAQYAVALNVLMGNIVRFDDVDFNVTQLPSFPLPDTAAGYVSLPFFPSWVVGFVMAEGSFNMKATLELFFTITQRSHDTLFSAFQLLFDTTRAIDNSEQGYSKFNVSSVKDLVKVVEFFSYSNHHPLVGYKKAQYDTWVGNMKRLNRFNGVKLP
jgi:hypothetical protein